MGKLTKDHVQYLVDSEDEDIPIVKNHETVKEWERKNNRGFWGCKAKGYIYDDD